MWQRVALHSHQLQIKADRGVDTRGMLQEDRRMVNFTRGRLQVHVAQNGGWNERKIIAIRAQNMAANMGLELRSELGLGA